MTYKYRELVRKPAGMLRVNSIEQEDLDFLVDFYGGGQPAEVWRRVLIEVAREKRHEVNSLSPKRVTPTVDKSPFGLMRTA
jgi:hypothetical protein